MRAMNLDGSGGGGAGTSTSTIFSTVFSLNTGTSFVTSRTTTLPLRAFSTISIKERLILPA
ncbi:hypothetical protein [Verrucomicrobium spinosum]|uniref:hypothetical protein n=1 Tax=Verrucomicrobium spinosum TaxID=2736 RepID=UPI001C488C29|nr:hypothetical protein [Verrucomicrobium spinosum]